jgi:predicted RNA-binding Zn-ribbon protein involved in translation (DUF1610 family)
MKWLIISLKSRKILNMMKDNAKPIKYGINKTKRNPLDEFICSECGFTCHNLMGYDNEKSDYYEVEPNYCPNCGIAIAKKLKHYI